MTDLGRHRVEGEEFSSLTALDHIVAILAEVDLTRWI